MEFSRIILLLNTSTKYNFIDFNCFKLSFVICSCLMACFLQNIVQAVFCSHSVPLFLSLVFAFRCFGVFV